MLQLSGLPGSQAQGALWPGQEDESGGMLCCILCVLCSPIVEHIVAALSVRMSAFCTILLYSNTVLLNVLSALVCCNSITYLLLQLYKINKVQTNFYYI